MGVTGRQGQQQSNACRIQGEDARMNEMRDVQVSMYRRANPMGELEDGKLLTTWLDRSTEWDSMPVHKRQDSMV
jgi:hypothetical protein